MVSTGFPSSAMEMSEDKEEPFQVLYLASKTICLLAHKRKIPQNILWNFYFVGGRGLEPLTLSTSMRCSTN